MKKTNLPSLVTISILTVITVIFWIIFSIIRIFTTEPDIKVASEVLEPIDPTLDTETLNNVQGRTFFSTGQTILTLPSPLPEVSPSPTATPTATSEATPL